MAGDSLLERQLREFFAGSDVPWNTSAIRHGDGGRIDVELDYQSRHVELYALPSNTRFRGEFLPQGRLAGRVDGGAAIIGPFGAETWVNIAKQIRREFDIESEPVGASAETAKTAADVEGGKAIMTAAKPPEPISETLAPAYPPAAPATQPTETIEVEEETTAADVPDMGGAPRVSYISRLGTKLDANGFLAEAPTESQSSPPERKWDENGYLLGERPRSVFPRQDRYRGGTHWSR